MAHFKHAQWSQMPLISLTEDPLTEWQFDKEPFETSLLLNIKFIHDHLVLHITKLEHVLSVIFLGLTS